ncbi:MAG: Ig-like domain-containing protein [Clostridiales bacterium]|nr:Ig-like domain-containing protein [Clostridiales bacterium]
MRKKLLAFLSAAALLCAQLAMIGVFAPIARAEGGAPASLPAVAAKGTNLFTGGEQDFSNGKLSATRSWGATGNGQWVLNPDGAAGAVASALTEVSGVPSETATAAKIDGGAGGTPDNDFLQKGAIGDKLGSGGMYVYFSAFVKVEQETWFDIAIEYQTTGWGVGELYDLGRKFKVSPSDGWTEIGKLSANYLPFRSHLTGNHENTQGSSSYNPEWNADETGGSCYFELPAEYTWATFKIYAYGGGAGPDGISGPWSNGLGEGDSYQITDVALWKVPLEEAPTVSVAKVEVTERAKVVADTESPRNTVTLASVVTPSTATDKTLSWESSDEDVATVADGVVTGVSAGTAVITATANDGSEKSASCAVTVCEDKEDVYVTPSQLGPITEIGDNSMRSFDGDFSDPAPIKGRAYGAGWTFTHTDEIGGFNQSNLGVWEKVGDIGAAEGMGGVNTALRITNKGNATQPLYDALTFSGLESAYKLDPGEHIYYFSFWVKVQQTTWFDVTISYANNHYVEADNYAVPVNHNEGQYFYDLGRKFKVTPEMGWVEVGRDEDGAYLPFRTHGLGTDPTNNISSSGNAERNKNEELGNCIIDLPDGLNWAAARIWAYGDGATGMDAEGVGVPSRTGFAADDSYDITAVSLWGRDTEAPYVPTLVDSVTLNKTAASVKVGETLSLTADVAPGEADDLSLFWESSDTSVATVDQDGKVTAKKIGEATITAYANDGGGASGSCTVTVVENTPGGGDDTTVTEVVKKGCEKAASGALAAAGLLLAVFAFKRKAF